VPPRALGRQTELSRIGGVLDRATAEPTFLRIIGEPGIGKTTMLEAARQDAAGRGFLVLSSSASSVESWMSYACLTDLLAPLVDELVELPDPQRLALEAALLRRTRMGSPSDVHTVGAGTLTLLDHACTRRPVLLALDDIQWWDEPSLRALTFAVRRCRVPYALIFTLREGHELPLEGLAGPGHDTDVMRLEGLTLVALHEYLVRSGHVLDRPTVRRILAMSRGNPLFARELARDPSAPAQPSDISTGMRSRLRQLAKPGRRALMVASAVADPTAGLLLEAGVSDPVGVLAEAEAADIVTWHGEHLAFTHPMWREVVYRGASAQRRRSVHTRLSETTLDVEERARHLVLSSPLLDATTLAALEDAATSARLRGAPSYAAELLGLALERGAHDPALVLQAALDHFAAGAGEPARQLATRVLELDASASQRAAALNLLGGITYLTDDFPQAITHLEHAYQEAEGDPSVRTGAAIDLAFACANLGMNQDGLAWTLRAEQNARLTGDPALLAEATGAATVLVFLSGGGVDRARLEVALSDEDLDRTSPPNRWPSMSAALVLLWNGELERARPALEAIRRRYDARGLDIGLPLLLARLAEAAILDGDLAGATALVAEIDEHARIAGVEAEHVMAMACRVVVAAYRGDLAGAAAEYTNLNAVTGGTKHLMAGLTAMAALGMCHLSAGEPDAAAGLLEPVGDLLLALGVGEPIVSPFFADAVEASASVGRAARAAPLVEMLESWGERSGSSWSTGVGARGRALLLLNESDLDGAESALGRSLGSLDGHSHRYERARTQLVSAALHRRRRQRALARETLVVAREEFAALGAAGWEAFADRELTRLGLHRDEPRDLTPSERRIAELASSGLTTAAVASRLSISAKTVEAHLTHIYAKLGIHSRAELGRWIAGQPDA
jgi:DNA-binding CsgD family transcriptional regulator/tetratricopeptide (TPR) repeat protein